MAPPGNPTANQVSEKDADVPVARESGLEAIPLYLSRMVIVSAPEPGA